MRRDTFCQIHLMEDKTIVNREIQIGRGRQWPLRLSLFFLPAFAFTWANWLPRVAVERGLFEAQLPEFFDLVAGYGPALAALAPE